MKHQTNLLPVSLLFLSLRAAIWSARDLCLSFFSLDFLRSCRILFHMSVSSFAASPLSRGNGGPRGRFRDMTSAADRLDFLPFPALATEIGGCGFFSSSSASHSKADTIS